jgi:hypothetical protein
MKFIKAIALATVLSCVYTSQASAQSDTTDTASVNTNSYSFIKLSPDISKKGFFNKDAEWFFSLGFNKTYYSPSSINVSQPSLGNNFTVNHVDAHDEYRTPGLRSPDNIRIGRFIDEDKVWGVDLSLDHDKYTTTLNQVAYVSGVNTGGVGYQTLSSTYFSYMLHNGLNQLMVDLVYRKPLVGSINESSSLAFIGRVGAGAAIVHPYNEINGEENDVGQKEISNLIGFNSGWWRIVGASTGVEAGVRYTVTKPFYIELTDKAITTYIKNVPVYQGSASQNILSNQIVLVFGYAMQ